MIIPSIDIQDGNAVQLIGGLVKAIDGGDPFQWAKKFGVAGEIAVIDLDAAMGKGENRNAIKELSKNYRCRVGGGIRTVQDGQELLNSGAQRIIIGTRATPDLLRELPKDRVIAALDARNGEVVIQGWKENTKRRVEERILELKGLVGGFLITLVETEGSMKGIDLRRCLELKEICGDLPLTVAGGVASVQEIATLDAAGIDVQVGMALYTGTFSYADGFLAPILKRPQPWPTVVCDEQGTALGLAWSTKQSVQAAFTEKRGVYFSRSRNSLWRKGESSGATQELLRVDLDCDRDCLRFTVKQNGTGFCHTEDYTCWGKAQGFVALMQTLEDRTLHSVAGSYTQKLLADERLLNAKILEETSEFLQARTEEEIISEAADLLYFTFVKLAKNRVSLADIAREFDERSLKTIRRGGEQKIFEGGKQNERRD